MYIAYKCLKCDTEFMISKDQVKHMEAQGRYLACPFGHYKIMKVNKYEGIRECMGHSHYKRSNGAIKQIG